MSRIFLSVCVLGLSLTAVAAGDLKQARDAQKLAAQKLVSQVDAAIDQSRKQDPADAKFALRAILDKVKSSPDLLEKERTPLVQRLQVRLTVVEDAARAKRVTQDQTPPRDTPRPRPPVNEPGKGVSGAASDIIGRTKSTAQAQSDLVRDREKGIRAVNQDNVVLSDKEITFAKNWKEISERRVSQKLTKDEVALLKALNSTMKIDYKGDKFKTVITHIMEKSGLTIIVDPTSLQDANVDYEGDTVTLFVPKMSVRTALKKILGDKGLTYIIKEGSLHVMTPKKASEYTVVRTYEIGDLATGDPRMAFYFGPIVAQFQMQQNANMLINLIQSTVEPSYWQPNGPGSISFFGRSLVVRASAEMHYQLGSPGLFGGR